MKCNNCGKENPVTMKFCGECGSKLEKLCPFCHEPVSPRAEFCLNCGEYLTVETEQANTNTAAEQRAPQTAYFIGSTQVSDNTMQEILSLVLQRKKLDAISVVRAATGMGLLEAKNWIEGFTPNNLSQYKRTVIVEDIPETEDNNPWRIGGVKVSANTFQEIKTLCRQNKKLDAIKVLREPTGFGLKEAKECIEFFMENELPYIN